MKSWVRLLFIFFAYGIALLHTAVPHHHASTGNGEQSIAAATCVFPGSDGGLLQRVLSTDLGTGHLETFKKGSDLEVVFASPAATVAVLVNLFHLVVIQQELPKRAATFIQKLQLQLLLSSVSHFRAPPVH